MLKKSSFVIMMLLYALLLTSCKKEEYSKLPPDLELSNDGYNLNFTRIHNDVIDYLSSEVMPFFFVKDNGFDISGDNENKSISITCNCISGTQKHDLDLFLSMALNGIAQVASEQDYRFKAPSVDNDGTYLDYGNIFDVYSLHIYATIEEESVLMDKTFKPGEKITIDPRYIKE